MLQLNSPIGGEGSNGGVIVPPSRCRDGILSLFLILKIINETNKSFKKLIQELPEYNSIQEKIRINKPINNKEIKDKLHRYIRFCLKENIKKKLNKVQE